MWRCAAGAALTARGPALRAAVAAGLATGCVQLAPRDCNAGAALSADRASYGQRLLPPAPAPAPAPQQPPRLSVPSVAEGGVAGMGVALAARARYCADGVRMAVDRRAETRDGRTILGIVALNMVVFALWKMAPAKFMVSHFASSLEAMRRGRVWTTVTANFSHSGVIHLGVNMFLLDQFGREVVEVLAPERFTVLYLAGGIASVLGSLATRRILRNNVLSLGASGSVMATMFMFANLFPERKLYLFGIWEMKARDALVLWALVDTAGLLGSFGKIDFAAHVSGGIFSLAYYQLIREDLAREYQARQRTKCGLLRSYRLQADDAD